MKKNSILLGIILGICVPVVGYALIQILFEQLVSAGMMDAVTNSISSRRSRMTALLGICCIIIPVEICRRHRLDQTIRGMLFPIFFYVLIWLFYYWDSIQF